jgi:hypothetical protein
MHESRGLNCVIWKNKCQILFISIHAQPISFPCVPYNEVPCRNGTVRENIPISHVLLEYIIFMRHIDIANQLRASYSSPIRSHEWWHMIFFAMLDMTKVNMYIMYFSHCGEGPNPVAWPMTHLEFKNALCETLLQGWIR